MSDSASAASASSASSSSSSTPVTGMTAAVLGASGNVGALVVKHLLSSPAFSRIILINRRQLDAFADAEKTGRLTQHIVKDMSVVTATASATTTPPLFQGVDALFVTMGVGAPSKLPRTDAGKQELMTIDCDLPTAFAHSAKLTGVKHLSLLSAVGSDINNSYSSITHTGAGGGWYCHVKARVEKNIIAEQFPSTGVFKPAAIIGNTNTGSFGSWFIGLGRCQRSIIPFIRINWLRPWWCRQCKD